MGIGDPTLADGILDRLVHNAHRIEMRGIRCIRIGVSRMQSDLLGGQRESTLS